jgi:hypothetical protein
MFYEFTIEDWNEAKRLLTLSDDQLHTLRLDELRKGAGLLHAMADLSKRRVSASQFPRVDRRTGDKEGDSEPSRYPYLWRENRRSIVIP